jgi:1-acyl-sn-glycerol-3-phosphate acyltransferase
MRYRAPVVPVGIVGAEEQMPQLLKIPVPGNAIPYIPVTASLVPLPVRYHIWYGEPIRVDQDYTPDDADDPEKVREAAARVKSAVQGLLERGLRERKGIFR